MVYKSSENAFRESNDSLAVVLVTDQNFLRYTIVAIDSMLARLSCPATVYLLTNQIEPADFKRSLVVLDKHSTPIHCLPLEPDQFSQFAVAGKRNNLNTYAKFQIADLVPEKWVLYLDSDLIVLDDLAPIRDYFHSNFSLLAVPNPAFPIWKDGPVLGFPAEQKTFNAGVMVLNLDKIRKENRVEVLDQFAKNYAQRLKLHDEPAWNYVFQADWGELPLKYNMSTLYFRRRSKKLGVPAKDLKLAKRFPAIIHFTGRDKPWKIESPHPLNQAWREAYQNVMGESIFTMVNWSDRVRRLKRKLKYLFVYYFR